MIETCKNCTTDFEIDEQDQAFYKKIQVPHPTHCPSCRHNRRWALRNERNLHSRSCDLCKENVISIFPKTSQYTTYCFDCWHGDSWSATDYGLEYDPNKTFFEQYEELQNKVPHIALHNDTESKNCKYVNYGLSNKNCYLALCAYCEDVYLSHGLVHCKSCMDCSKSLQCELCYQCVDCKSCYSLFFSKDCQNCSESYFLNDCQSCSNCFSCVGLRNKKFVFMNEQLTEKEYKERLKKMEFTNQAVDEWQKKLHQAALKTPHKYMHGLSNDNVTGDYLDNTKNLKECFDCFDDAENLSYCEFCALKCYDSYDTGNAGLAVELCYESHGIIACNNCKFISGCRHLQDCEYSQSCTSSKNLFGCLGLSHKQNCILNKEYSEKEYNKLRKQIIEKMKEDKEYGEFFPINSSKFAYNETVAHEFNPISKKEALAKGYKWKDPEKSSPQPNSLKCKECKIHYKIIAQEAKFYQKHKLPTPEKCPNCRHTERFVQRNPRKLWNRECNRCHAELKTSYSPDKPEIIYCQKCYEANLN